MIFQIYDWRPEFYNDTRDLPEKMPRHLKDYILTQARIDARTVSEDMFTHTCLVLNLGTHENVHAGKNENQHLFMLFICTLV
jgi:hypothetical protein